MAIAVGALALGVVILVAGAGPAFAQCSMCQQVVSQSPEVRKAGMELNLAILVLFAAPYLVFATLAVVLLRPQIERYLRKRFSRAFGRAAAAGA
jgi:hypothetical protein